MANGLTKLEKRLVVDKVMKTAVLAKTHTHLRISTSRQNVE